MLADPVLQEPNWRSVAQRGVAATPVGEDIDVLEQVGFSVGSGLSDRAMQPFVLLAVEEALAGRGISIIDDQQASVYATLGVRKPTQDSQ